MTEWTCTINPRLKPACDDAIERALTSTLTLMITITLNLPLRLQPAHHKEEGLLDESQQSPTDRDNEPRIDSGDHICKENVESPNHMEWKGWQLRGRNVQKIGYHTRPTLNRYLYDYAYPYPYPYPSLPLALAPPLPLFLPVPLTRITVTLP